MGAVKERGGMGKGASLPQDNPKPALLPPPENTNRFPIKSLRYVTSEYKMVVVKEKKVLNYKVPTIL